MAPLGTVPSRPVSFTLPGTKLVACEDDATVVVFPNDAVEIYSGGGKTPLEILSYNPRTGEARFEAEGEKPAEGSVESLEADPEARMTRKKGEAILAAEHYSLPSFEREELFDWMRSLQSRKEISREAMWRNESDGALVAGVLSIPKEMRSPDHPKQRVECLALGKFTGTDPDNWSQCFFESSNPDSRLRESLLLTETKEGEAVVASQPFRPQQMISSFAAVYPIEQKEAEWLQRFTLPPSRRFLNAHQNYLAFRASRGEENRRFIPSREGEGRKLLGGVAV